MTSFQEKAKMAIPYIEELEKFRNMICGMHETCSTCPLYGASWDNKLDACWATYHLKDLFL